MADSFVVGNVKYSEFDLLQRLASLEVAKLYFTPQLLSLLVEPLAHALVRCDICGTLTMATDRRDSVVRVK